MSKSTTRRLLRPAVAIAAALAILTLGAAEVAAQRQPPPGIQPMSINAEDIPYPHPVHYLDLTLYGEDVRMAYMDVQPSGASNGRTVMLFHGMNWFGEYFRDTIEVLADAGFRVVVPDQVGFGRSSKPFIPYDFNLHAANSKALLDELGIAGAAIAGHSMGGRSRRASRASIRRRPRTSPSSTRSPSPTRGSSGPTGASTRPTKGVSRATTRRCGGPSNATS